MGFGEGGVNQGKNRHKGKLQYKGIRGQCFWQLHRVGKKKGSFYSDLVCEEGTTRRNG